MATTKRAAELKAGDRVTIQGFSGAIAHIRKSRRYPGFMAIQVADPSSPVGVRAFDVAGGDLVPAEVR